MPRVKGPGGEGVQAVVLALHILERLAEERRPMGVTTLATALGTTKSRIWRHLQTLVQQGYIVQSGDTERYEIGARLIALGNAVGEGLDLVTAGYRALRELRDRLGHFSVISQFEPEGARILVHGFREIRHREIGVRQGSLLGFHNSAQGKIALAFGDDALRCDGFQHPARAEHAKHHRRAGGAAQRNRTRAPAELGHCPQ